VKVDSNWLSDDHQKTVIDKEREMFLLKRRMTKAYSKGHYRSALDIATELEGKSLALRSGCTWPVYQEMLLSKAIPFLTENNPQLLIVCMGRAAVDPTEERFRQQYSVRVRGLLYHLPDCAL